MHSIERSCRNFLASFVFTLTKKIKRVKILLTLLHTFYQIFFTICKIRCRFRRNLSSKQASIIFSLIFITFNSTIFQIPRTLSRTNHLPSTHILHHIPEQRVFHRRKRSKQRYLPRAHDGTMTPFAHSLDDRQGSPGVHRSLSPVHLRSARLPADPFSSCDHYHFVKRSLFVVPESSRLINAICRH